MTTNTTTRRTYRIVRRDQLQAGDILKTTGARVVNVTVDGDETEVEFTTGRGRFLSTERIGIRRGEETTYTICHRCGAQLVDVRGELMRRARLADGRRVLMPHRDCQ